MDDELESFIDMASTTTPVKRIIKFPAATIHSIKNKAENKSVSACVMCKFRATCHVSLNRLRRAAEPREVYLKLTQPITAHSVQ